MYETTASAPGSRKQKLGTGYLARPRLTTFKGLYAGKPVKSTSSIGSEKRKKLKKPNAPPKMEFRKRPDYADTAYREAVGRLRILLAESYTPIKRPNWHLRELDSAGDETDNQSLVSAGSRILPHSYYTNPIIPRRYTYFPIKSASFNVAENKTAPTENKAKWDMSPTAPPELMSFIERQEEYIEQLERESRFCRDELATLLSKVKDVISENEHLHEKQKNKLIQSVFDHLETETETETEFDRNKQPKSPKLPRKHTVLEGPTIVFESRISELEAQLTQTKIDLRKAQEENEIYKRKIADGTISSELGYDDPFKKQIDTLQSEKMILHETVSKLQASLEQLRNKEYDTCDQVKRSLDVAEQAQYEKSAAEIEIRRLKDELERQHGKLRDAIADQGRRIAEERNTVERRYSQQIEQLSTELAVQWEATSKLQLELDKQRRENSDLRREIAQKQAQIEELKKEIQNKMTSMQADIGATSAEKSALEHQVASLQLANERNERQSKQEMARMQAEMQSLRQRLDRADADLIHSRRENIRLSEQVASLEKEINMNAAMADERSKRRSNGGTTSAAIALPAPTTPKKEQQELEVSSMMHDIEAKHAATVAELEGMIFSQNQLMDKLSNECHVLTQKLEDASNRHKEEIRELQTNLNNLSSRFSQSLSPSSKTAAEGHNKTGSQRTSPTTVTEKITSPRNRILRRTSSIASIKLHATPQETIVQPIYMTTSRKPSITSNFGSHGNSPQYVTQHPEYEQVYYDDGYNTNQVYDPNQHYVTDNVIYDQPHYVTQEQYDQSYVVDPNVQYVHEPQYQPYETQYIQEEYLPQQYVSQKSNEQYKKQLQQGKRETEQQKQIPKETKQEKQPPTKVETKTIEPQKSVEKQTTERQRKTEKQTELQKTNGEKTKAELNTKELRRVEPMKQLENDKNPNKLDEKLPEKSSLEKQDSNIK